MPSGILVKREVPEQLILNSKDSSSFSLSLEAVPLMERPTPGINKWESWLNIKVSVCCPQGSWQVTDECLLLHESEELAEWLKALAVGQAVEKEIFFTEPNLQFQVLDEAISDPVIRVSFMAEMRPPWGRGKVFGLDIHMTLDNLSLAAQRLQEEVFNYTRR